jgi:transposase InsO family protein
LIVGLIKKKRKVWKRGSSRALFKSLEIDFREHKINLGRDKFFDLLRRNNLFIHRKKCRVITTNSYHHYHKYKNLIKDKIPMKANEIWVCDITYIWLIDKECFCYLFLITDMYSRKVIGYCVHETLKATGAVNALSMSMSQSKSAYKDCIHHSDRGIQYCCDLYTKKLADNGFIISMTEDSEPTDNAIAERVNRTIKEEFTTEKEISFKNFIEANKQLKKFIEFYNTDRPHSSVEWLTPNEAHTREGVLKKYWKTYKKSKCGGTTKA